MQICLIVNHSNISQRPIVIFSVMTTVIHSHEKSQHYYSAVKSVDNLPQVKMNRPSARLSPDTASQELLTEVRISKSFSIIWLETGKVDSGSNPETTWGNQFNWKEYKKINQGQTPILLHAILLDFISSFQPFIVVFIQIILYFNYSKVKVHLKLPYRC